MFDTEHENRSTDHFYESFIDIKYALYTFCWTRTILGSSYKMSHTFHQEICMRHEVSPINKMRREEIRHERSKSFFARFGSNYENPRTSAIGK